MRHVRHAPPIALPLLALGLLTATGRADRAATTAPAAAPQHVTYTQQSPVGGLAEYCRRTRQSALAYERDGTEHAYNLPDESFELFVPGTSGPDESLGLLVWISPAGARLPPEWHDVLERHRLVWVCPNNAGNRRHVVARIGLALDAVHNVRAARKIDPQRVYVAGFSGGGRVSSIIALTYPDVFTGALCMMGSNFYRNLPAGDGKVFRASAARPIDPILNRAKRLPVVLLTGEHDENQPQTKANHAAFQKDGFKDVTYIEVPGIGHALPEVEWLEKALTHLDAAAHRAATRPTTRPTTRRAGLPATRTR